MSTVLAVLLLGALHITVVTKIALWLTRDEVSGANGLPLDTRAAPAA